MTNIYGREVDPWFTDEELIALFEKHIEFKKSSREEVYDFAKIVRDAVEKKVYEQSITGVMEAATEWQDRTFPQATLQSIANHLVKEAEELAANPHDQVEVADILFLIGHWIHKTKHNMWAVMRNKLRINMGRTWGEVNEQGFVEHVREEPTVHHMKLDSEGRPYGIGHTE